MQLIYRIPTNDLVPPIRRTRNHQSLAFKSLLARTDIYKSRKENPQKLTQLSPDLIQDISWGKRTAQKDAIKDITSDSQVNSYFPYRWSPASLTINIYFYLLLYLYITKVTINNGTQHLKSLKSQNRRAALGWSAIKLLGGLN